MRQPSPRFIANFDSASAMLRALAASLHGRDFPALGTPLALRPIMVAANELPRGARETLYTWAGWTEACAPSRLDRVRAESIARWMTSLYPRRRYPAVMIGASNGALIHLCAALGIPWLPQTWLIPVRHPGLDRDEPRASLRWGTEPGRRLLEANPELALHHMHDAIQDRLMIQWMAYFRVKRLQLGWAYEKFLRDSLGFGGTIFVAECRYRWPVTRLSRRHVFQHGAAGGLSPDEYVAGSKRVEAFLQRQRSPWRRWVSPVPNDDAPEAEWGFAPQIWNSITAFAKRHRCRVRLIIFDDPDDASPFVADLYRWWYASHGLRADRLVIDSFILMDPCRTIRVGAVPFWTKFSVEPSARAAERYLEKSDPFDTIAAMMFSHGVDSIGLATVARWREIVGHARRYGTLLGVDPQKFPADFGTFARYQAALRELGLRPAPPTLTLAELDSFIAQSRGQYAIDWREGPFGPPPQADETLAPTAM